MTIRLFFDPDFTRYVLFTTDALAHMYAQVQRKPWHKEAGGELFTNDPGATGLVVTAASGPNAGDHRSRHSWNPDLKAADRDRQQHFVMGRHAIGLWHTHPESLPSPSGQDRRTTDEYLAAFHGERGRYLMVILGNRGDPPNIAVWAADRGLWNTWTELVEISASSVFGATHLRHQPKHLPKS